MNFEEKINEFENSSFDGNYIILNGSVPILFSAPHTIVQQNDNGTIKLNEPHYI